MSNPNQEPDILDGYAVEEIPAEDLFKCVDRAAKLRAMTKPQLVEELRIWNAPPSGEPVAELRSWDRKTLISEILFEEFLKHYQV